MSPRNFMTSFSSVGPLGFTPNGDAIGNTFGFISVVQESSYNLMSSGEYGIVLGVVTAKNTKITKVSSVQIIVIMWDKGLLLILVVCCTLISGNLIDIILCFNLIMAHFVF